MAQLLTVRLNKSDQQPLGFRLQGGKDFGTPLVVQKVNGGSSAERAGLQAGDALIRVNNTDVYTLRHQEAQDTIRAAGGNLELTVQRGGGTWRPAVTPTGSLPRPGSRPLGTPTLVTNTSLKATPTPSQAFGSGHNNVAKPFGYMNGNESVKSIVNNQYNTPVKMYSDKTIAETLSAQTEVLAGGVLGVNFKKNEKTYDAEKSAVFKVLQEEQNDPEPEVPTTPSTTPVSGLRHVQAPVTRPDAPINNTGGLPPGQNICEECERLITGVFVRIKDKNLHVECFKCSTCGNSLKNQGYYNLNGKLYCDIHAKLVARQNPPASNLEPVTVPPGGRIPLNTYSTPLPPLATNNYTNGSSALFSPSSNLSGPKPFGSSIGSAYSPASLSPRSAPLSPARPAPVSVAAPPPASFAPTPNVKSVVWPPPANPDTTDDEPQYEPSLKIAPSICSKDMPSVNKLKSEFENNIANMQQSIEQLVTSSKQTEEFSSSVCYATAAMSSMSASSKTESVVQSTQSQVIKETSQTMQSYSQASSQFQNTSVFQSSLPEEKNRKTEINESVKQLTVGKDSKHVEVLETNNDSIAKVNRSDIKENDTILTSNATENITNTQTTEREDPTQMPTRNVESIVDNNFSSEIKSKTECTNVITSSIVTETLQSNIISSTSNQQFTASMVDTLTTAPDRTIPLSIMPQSNSLDHIEKLPPENVVEKEQPRDTTESKPQTQPSPLFAQETKRGVTPIPPIKQYNPPGKNEPPIPMPEETKPYIPPDFKIIVEPKISRQANNASPFVDALTTAPDRPFTPTSMQQPIIERGSLRDALTIAPDRTFSPFGAINVEKQSNQFITGTISNVTETNLSDIVRPIATQTTTQLTNKVQSEFSTIQNTCQLQSSSATSAFKPVAKQVFPPPLPDEFNKTTSNFSVVSNESKSTKFKQEQSSYTESMLMQQSSCNMASQGYSSVKSAQNYFEQLDKQESMSSIAVRSKSGLHKPDAIPSYQKNFDQLLSQRGITPEIYNAPAVLQRPVTPTTDPPTKPKDKSVEPQPAAPIPNFKPPQIKTPVQQPPVHFHKDAPITMAFQPVCDDNFMRVSPSRSRPTTPSLINKPAPIIPHYQMNLVAVEHIAADSHLHEPSSRECSRTPTPNPRSHSPAQGPPPNPLKAQAPRIKEPMPKYYSTNTYVKQDNFLRNNQSDQRDYNNVTDFNESTLAYNQSHPVSVIEQRQSNTDCKSENFTKGDIRIKQDSVRQENYGQRQMQCENVVEQGNTTVHTTKKTFEEFERTQSAKVIEIRKGGSSISGGFNQKDANIQGFNQNLKQVFPPPVMSLSHTQQGSSVNVTNQNIISSASRLTDNTSELKPPICGANPGPVCDPTPSTGPSIGAAARGKAFGVSSAPKRGRGVLNKPALPGSRVPLCASCNGNIRGPFITALGRIWCPDHFICVNATCRRPLQDIGFVEENGQLYCEFCFEQYIAPACDKCHGKIKGDCLNAIGKHYHPECFNCVYCGKLFGNNPFFLEDGLPYCEADWNDLFTTKCFACGFPVEAGDRWVEALNNNYHSQCFNCTVCKKNLEGQSFFAKGGRPFCKTHAR